MTTDEAIADLIVREGGYVDDPLDIGGATKFGITRATLAVWKGRDVSIDEVKQLSATEAAAIYRQRFVVETGYGAIKEDRLRALMVDAAANHGPANANRMIQRALGGVTVDGIFGIETLKAVNAAPSPSKLWLCLLSQRIRLYGRIIENAPSQARFAAGWANRVADLLMGFVSA